MLPLRFLPRHPSSWLALAAGAYAVALTGLFFRQREILYRAPRATQSLDPPVEVVPCCTQGPSLNGWVDNPGQGHALLYFGGSSESVELRRTVLAMAFPHHTRYLVPYRGFGPNRFLKSEESALKTDARRTFACVASQHAHVDVLGRSLGTGVALHVAARAPVRRLGLITPYDSIVTVAQSRYRWLPVSLMLRDRFESWRDALSIKAPVFAVLAETDPVIPHRCWENLRLHLSAPVEVITAPHTNHTTVVDSPATWSALRNFFETEEAPLALP